MSFPLLSIEFILKELNVMFPDLRFFEEDFRGPKLNPERIQKLYHAFLYSALDVTQDQLIQPQLEALDTQEHPEIHEDGNYISKVLIALQRLMFACSVKHFNIEDLIEPTLKRTRYNISALINFCYFQSERLETYHQVKEENQAILDQCAVLIKENEELQKKINNIRTMKVEQEPEIKKYEKEIEELQINVAGKQKSAAEKQRYIAELKTSTSQKKAKQAQLQTLIASAKEEGCRLSRMIVQSPERMKGQMERMNQQKILLQQAREIHAQRLVKLTEQKENCQKIENEMEGMSKVLATIASTMEKEKSILTDIDNIREQFGEKRDELRELEKKEQQLNRQITSKQEKMAKMSLHHEYMTATMKETIKQLEKDKSTIGKSKSAEAQQITSLETERLKLAEEHRTAAHEHELTMEKIKFKESELLEQVESYNTQLGIAWEKSINSLKSAK